MNCNEVNDLIQRYLDGDLTVQEQEKMTKHLENCKECQSFYERIQHVHLGLESLPKVNVPFSIVDSILPKIEQLEREDKGIQKDNQVRMFPKRWLQIFTTAAASIVIILMVNQLWNSFRHQDGAMEEISANVAPEVGEVVISSVPSIENNQLFMISSTMESTESSKKMGIVVDQSNSNSEPLPSPDNQFLVYYLGNSLEIIRANGELIYQQSVGEDEQIIDLLWIDEQHLQYQVQTSSKLEVWIIDVRSGIKELLDDVISNDRRP